MFLTMHVIEWEEAGTGERQGGMGRRGSGVVERLSWLSKGWAEAGTFR